MLGGGGLDNDSCLVFIPVPIGMAQPTINKPANNEMLNFIIMRIFRLLVKLLIAMD